MNTITCPSCGEEIELSEALTKDIEKTVLAAEHKKHKAEIEKIRNEASVAAKKEASAELESAKKKIESEIVAKQRRETADREHEIKELKAEATNEKQANKELRDKLSEMMAELRAQKKATENAELEMQKRLATEEEKIKEDATKAADEKYRLKLEEKDKKLRDTQKALDEAQRKAAQESQQLQGEVLELNVEEALKDAFRDDEIEPIGKGVKGTDIRQVVKSPRGTECGVILWECKSHKNWKDEWIDTIKTNLRSAKANLPIIVTHVMPKHLSAQIGNVNGVWVCKPPFAIVLGTLLRKSLLDVGLQKALAKNQGTKAEALFTFVTSHVFVQQVEAMIETYMEMISQVQKERIAYEKFWALREGQARKLLEGTSNIIGGIAGQIGSAAMPRIKGLDLLDAPEEARSEE